MEAGGSLQRAGWLPWHLPASDVVFAFATVLLFLPAVVLVHRAAEKMIRACAAAGKKKD